jgi:hypothetical protein
MPSQLTSSKKARALLISLANLNIVYFVSIWLKVPGELVGSMISAILFLTGVYVAGQSGVDMIATYKSKDGSTTSIDAKE